MTRATDVAEQLYGLACDEYVADGGTRPYVACHGPFRVALGAPDGDGRDAVEWAAGAAFTLGAVVGATIVGMVSEAWMREWRVDDAPEHLARGELERRHAEGDAKVETSIVTVAASRLGDTAWILGQAHLDEVGTRRVERRRDAPEGTEGRMLDTMRAVARTLVDAPPPPLDLASVEQAFRFACTLSGTTGSLMVPLRSAR